MQLKIQLSSFGLAYGKGVLGFRARGIQVLEWRGVQGKEPGKCCK